MYLNKAQITPNQQDEIEDLQFEIPNKLLNFWTTESIDTGKLDKNNNPILRTPNEDEFKEYMNKVFEQSINNIRAIRDIAVGEGNKTYPQNRTIEQFNEDIEEDNRVRARAVILTAQQLQVEAPFIDGKQLKPSLQDVAEQFSYGDSITPDGIIASFNDADGNFNEEEKDSLKQLLKFTRVSDIEIKRYGLVDKGVLENKRLEEYIKNTSTDVQGELIEGNNTTNKEIKSTEAETENEFINNTEDIKNINDFDDIIDPKLIEENKVDAGSLNKLGNIANNFVNALTGTQSAQAGEFQKPVMNPEVLKLIDDEDKILSAKDIGIKDEKDEPNGARRQEHNFVIFYNLAKKYGHKFPELTAAQAMHETLNGASPSGKNNYLGFEANRVQIKRGESSLLDTKQDFGKGLEKTKEDFVDFEDIRDQFIQYKNEWNDPFADRKGIVSVNTPEEALDLILSRPDDMYATDKDYKQKVLNILYQAKLPPALF